MLWSADAFASPCMPCGGQQTAFAQLPCVSLGITELGLAGAPTTDATVTVLVFVTGSWQHLQPSRQIEPGAHTAASQDRPNHQQCPISIMLMEAVG